MLFMAMRGRAIVILATLMVTSVSGCDAEKAAGARSPPAAAIAEHGSQGDRRTDHEMPSTSPAEPEKPNAARTLDSIFEELREPDPKKRETLRQKRLNSYRKGEQP